MGDILLTLTDAELERLQGEASRSALELEEHIKMLLVARKPAHLSTMHTLNREAIEIAGNIESAYRDFGYSLGWRFITCPEAWIDNAKLAIVSMNPSGDRPHGPSWSQESGSAYVVESWDGRPAGKDVLQRQISALLALLGLDFEEAFSAHFVPFRSPNWATLDNKSAALALGENLWKWLIDRTSARTFVCLGKEEIGPRIAKLADAAFVRSLPIGWGTMTADVYQSAEGRRVYALPHPSRFQVFGRQKSIAALKELFA